MTFQLRIVQVDHYMTTPNRQTDKCYSEFCSLGTKLRHVPVIRIFGVTEMGQKALLHVHQVFPYFYVEYTGPVDDSQQVSSLAFQLGVSINHALALQEGHDRNDPIKSQYVAAVQLVQGIPYYGFHAGYSQFFKVSMLDPRHVKTASELVQSGSVMGAKMQPFEAHIPYILQFFLDYNLYGMDFIRFSKVQFRLPVRIMPSLPPRPGVWRDYPVRPMVMNDVWDEDSVRMDWKWSARDAFPRQSDVELELDGLACFILNRNDVVERKTEALIDLSINKNVPGEEKNVPSLESVWKDEVARRRRRGMDSQIQISESQTLERQEREKWSIEDDLWQEVEARLSQSSSMVEFPTFDPSLPTTWKSVEHLWTTRPDEEENQANFTHSQYQNVPAVVNEQEIERQKTQSIPSSPSQLSLTPGDLEIIELLESLKHMDDPDGDIEKFLESQDIQQVDDAIQEYDESIPSAVLEPWDPPFEESIEESQDWRFSRSTQTPKRVPQYDGPIDSDEEQTPPRKAMKPLSFYVEKNSPKNKERFAKSMLDLWSPPQSKSEFEEAKPAFFHSKPTIMSPTKSPVKLVSKESTETPVTSKTGSRDNSQSIPLAQTSVKTTPISSQSNILDDMDISPNASIVIQAFQGDSNVFTPKNAPPTNQQVLTSLKELDIHEWIHPQPRYTNPNDVPSLTKRFGARDWKIPGTRLQDLLLWKPGYSTENFSDMDTLKSLQNRYNLTDRMLMRSRERFNTFAPMIAPPTSKQVSDWIREKRGIPIIPETIVGKAETNAFGTGMIKLPTPSLGTATPTKQDVSQIPMVTQKDKYGFKFDEATTDAITHERQYLTVMSVEVHARTRQGLLPDPELDEILGIFYTIQHDNPLNVLGNGHRKDYHVGAILVDVTGKADYAFKKYTGLNKYHVTLVPTEVVLYEELIDLVHFHDPDIVVGFEIHNASWGLLVERAPFAMDDVRYNLCQQLSRVTKSSTKRHTKDEDAWGFSHASSVHITGRIVLNIWRLMRSELNLTSYNMENLSYHILHQRTPRYSCKTLTEWFDSQDPNRMWRTCHYYFDRCQKDLEMLDDTDMIGRTSEFARVFGVDFYSVISRGSQFKVESVMSRIVKLSNFVMISPSKQQIADQRAAECLPLIMEPESRFYTNPVIVLDFQSLYPSVMIAYNMCFSTCLGRTAQVGKNHKFGASELEIAPEVVERLRDHINITPNGLIFVKPHIRKGVLGKMLTEILDTRVMVKQSMKIHRDDKSLLRLLEARQLGLKYIANVTYGYTSASFSGRMPCVDIADAIVQTGRETLEHAIALIHGRREWGARVVYADTDSLFILCEGSSKERAFVVGKEIVDEVTKRNPVPVKLKFEKVYHPCILQTKKRYVGAMWETPDQQKFEFDAKGIETVRRDGCPLVAKTEEACLHLLFKSMGDVSLVKQYLQNVFTMIMQQRVPIQDFTIAREIKLGTYSEKSIDLPPPQLRVVQLRRQIDKRDEPQYGERIPFVIVYNTDGATRLTDQAVSPEWVLKDPALRINGLYYIEKQLIPPLQRLFQLLGADVESWWKEVPKVNHALMFHSGTKRKTEASTRGNVLEYYFKPHHCMVCRVSLQKTDEKLCDDCMDQPREAYVLVLDQAKELERKIHVMNDICRRCTGLNYVHEGDTPDNPVSDLPCISLDCPVLYLKSNIRHKLKDLQVGMEGSEGELGIIDLLRRRIESELL